MLHAGHVTLKMGTWSWWLHPGNLQPWGKDDLGTKRERPEGSAAHWGAEQACGVFLGCRAGPWGALKALEGSRAPLQPPQRDAQATPEPLHGSLLMGGTPDPAGERGALLHPARGRHPTPRCVLLLLKPPCASRTLGVLRASSVAPAPQFPWPRAGSKSGSPCAEAELSCSQQCPWCRGAQREGTPVLVTVCHCSGAWGGGRHGMCGGVVAGGHPRAISCRCF